MSALRREVILEELGLTPLWTRRSVLAERALADEVEAPLAVMEAPQDVASPAPMLATVTPLRPPLPFVEPKAEPVPPAVETPVEFDREERARRIAELDWTALQAEVATCTACDLCKSRSQTVFGVGNPEADWVVVGEAPGAEEDRQGEPFVGQAGKLLDNMLAAVAHSRQSNVYILNTLKCRPPQNRNPDPTELALCAPFLHRQIELIQPKVIMATGRFAVQTLLGREASISSLRGKVHEYRRIPVVVTYHPAYLLRNMPDKYKAWQDLLLTRKTLANRQADAQAGR